MWTQINSKIGYFQGSVNQGVIFGESGAILVDTGLDKQAGRKLIRLLDELGVKLSAIMNTHSHADHFGGNQELLAHYGEQVRVYAPIFEESAIRHPIWEPTYLFSGAYPISEMENKFLFAPASPVHVVIEPGSVVIDGVELHVVPLYGHAYRQMGIAYQEVLFAADGFFGEEVLVKHPIPFHIDTKETLATLDWLSDSPYEQIIPGHGAMLSNRESIKETMIKNRIIYESVMELILQNLNQPLTIDMLQAKVCNHLGLSTNNAGSYLLYRTAIHAQLKYLLDQGQIKQQVMDNQWLWEISRT